MREDGGEEAGGGWQEAGGRRQGADSGWQMEEETGRPKRERPVSEMRACGLCGYCLRRLRAMAATITTRPIRPASASAAATAIKINGRGVPSIVPEVGPAG